MWVCHCQQTLKNYLENYDTRKTVKTVNNFHNIFIISLSHSFKYSNGKINSAFFHNGNICDFSYLKCCEFCVLDLFNCESDISPPAFWAGHLNLFDHCPCCDELNNNIEYRYFVIYIKLFSQFCLHWYCLLVLIIKFENFNLLFDYILFQFKSFELPFEK